MESVETQSGQMKHMRHFMAEFGLEEEEFEFYGKYTGKIRLRALRNRAERKDGKLILVTAMTPTRAGEGKTLTSIGLSQGLQHQGHRALVTLREPSLGPVFGIKGGGTGGGQSQIEPSGRVNLHFNGDLHAVTTAHNLLAAMIDNHLHQGNELNLDVTRLSWDRAMDMNDRALRKVTIGLGGAGNSVPRESGFIITAASEIMAVLALAESRQDLKERLGRMIIGYTREGRPVEASELNAQRALAVVLNEAIMPNLVQTTENVPALVHAGPFANIAHGTNSILANRIGLKFADYVVTEAGFGADLGAEKFFDIVGRKTDLWPSAMVLVATARALKWHGGAEDLEEENMKALKAGMPNLERHIENLKKFGVPSIVALNRFSSDTDREIDWIKEWCEERDIDCVPHTAFQSGGAGAADLADAVVDAADEPAQPTTLYPLEDTVEEKIEKLAKNVYGADDIYLETPARKALKHVKQLGYEDLPICVAKTQASLSDDKTKKGAPSGWTLTVTDIRLSAGAGFLVVVCGNMMLMPGLPKHPSALDVDVDEDGNISGLF